MRYQGSKKRIAKEIVEIIHNNLNDKTYVEPFIGGCNIFKDVIASKKIGSDSNVYLIDIWKELQNNTLTIPSNITKEKYFEIKNSYLNKDNKYSNGTIGITGFLASYGGRFWNGYANFNPKKNENHVKEALNGLKKDWGCFKSKENTHFIHSDYSKLIVPNNSLIYCDPPYQSTLSYKETNDFNSEDFWEWCRTQERNGNLVLVSEYNAPNDFVCIWKKEITCGMNSKKGSKQPKRCEKLFVHKNELKNIKLNGTL